MDDWRQREGARIAMGGLRKAVEQCRRSGHKQAHLNFGALGMCLDTIDAALALPCDTAVEAHSCKTCAGRRKVIVLEGTCQPQHEVPCPVCVGRTIATVTVPLSPATPDTDVGAVFDLDGIKKLWRTGVETGRILERHAPAHHDMPKRA